MSKLEAYPRRLFVECTHTYLKGGSDGIRRVARGLANQCRDVSTDDIMLVPVIWGGIGFYAPRPPFGHGPHPLHQLATKGVALFRRLRLAPKSHPADNSAASHTPRDGGLSFRDKTEEAFYVLFGILASISGPLMAHRVRFRPGDIIVLVDATWDSDAMLNALFSAQHKKGICLGVMVHDLFPLTAPEWCEDKTVGGFRRWFHRVAPNADFFITNSEATRRSLHDFLAEHPTIRAQPVRSASFRLGADLSRSAASTGDRTPSISALSGFVVLAVGTLEPRKNYEVLLDAMDKLSLAQSVSLLIVGKVGWSCQGVVQRIAQHPLRGTRIFHFDDADDGELLTAYRRADCLVCASWAEGFGLPVVEGLFHGLPVIASDIAVFREIGEDHCRYFPAGDASGLAQQILAVAREQPKRAPARADIDTLCPSWLESTRQFKDATLAIAADACGGPP